MQQGMLIQNGDVIVKDRIARRTSVLIQDGRIARVGRFRYKGNPYVVDASDCYVSPGFIDTHIHGDPADVLDNEIRYGTTSIIVAESCASIKSLCGKADRVREFRVTHPLGLAILGMRIEGPYINKIKAGAQDARYIRRPDRRELAALLVRCGGALKMMTVAPELRGALPLVGMLAAKGIIVSAGHTEATYEEGKRGMRAGIRHATHIFNAMRDMTSREPGIAGAILSDRKAFAEVILDLVHVHKALFTLLVNAKGPDKVVLVTDSVKALRQRGVRRSRGAYRFSDGRLAGSSLTMIGAVKNAVQACGLDVPSAVRCATLNPAKLLGVQARKGSLEAGKDADVVIFDKKFNTTMTVVHGRIIYHT